MRIRLVSLSVVLLLWGVALAHATAHSTYYLALGDSLAQGIQPSASGDVATNQGYPDDLYVSFRGSVPGLGLAKLGCSGETTTTMIEGGICSYPEGSQLRAAVNFLKTHAVTLVTIDIGANDIDHCISTTGINEACVAEALNTVTTNLPQILTELRSAAGADTPIFAMNYYDPFLVAWELGSAGQALADASLRATNIFNGVLQSAYQTFGVPVADVAHAFRISNFTPVPVVDVPLNVFLTGTWTWMDAAPPLGPDIHPNAAGYMVVANAFEQIITLP